MLSSLGSPPLPGDGEPRRQPSFGLDAPPRLSCMEPATKPYPSPLPPPPPPALLLATAGPPALGFSTTAICPPTPSVWCACLRPRTPGPALRPISPTPPGLFLPHGVSCRPESALCSWPLSLAHVVPSARSLPLVSRHWPAPRPLSGSCHGFQPSVPVSPHVSAQYTCHTPDSRLPVSSTRISQPNPVWLKQGRTWPDRVLQERLEPVGPVRSPGLHTAASAAFSRSGPCAHSLPGDPATFFPLTILPGLTHQSPVLGRRGRVS